MSKYAVFTGRSSRSEFWGFIAILVVIGLAGIFLDGYMASVNHRRVDWLYFWIVMLPHVLPAVAVQVRRLHDTDRSGALVLLNVVPLFGVLLLIWGATRGTVGPNRYGPNPLQAVPVAFDASMIPSMTPISASAPAMSRHDVIGELERLSQLRANGHLSEAEFDVMKAEALSKR